MFYLDEIDAIGDEQTMDKINKPITENNITEIVYILQYRVSGWLAPAVYSLIQS